MNVAIISSADYGGAGYRLTMCLQAVGLDAQHFSAKGNSIRCVGPRIRFKKLDQIADRVKHAQCIIFMHSAYLNPGLDLSNYRVFVYHGGSRYRQSPELKNDIFNPIVEKSIIQTADMLDLGAKDQVWLLPGMDTENLKPIYKNLDDKRLVLGHYPSSGNVKNSDMINKVIRSTKDKRLVWQTSNQRVFWPDNINRVRKCDVYVEACAPKQGDKIYGEWGMACLEAACLGKVVVTHFINSERYKREYGDYPLIVANSKAEMRHAVDYVLSLSNEEIINLQHATRNWVEKYHSYKAVGKRFVDKVLGGKL